MLLIKKNVTCYLLLGFFGLYDFFFFYPKGGSKELTTPKCIKRREKKEQMEGTKPKLH
jgi:hypothetical protein